MSRPVGAGYSEREYDKRKRAHDFVEERLRKHGVSPEKARQIANKTANETDNEQRSRGK